MIYDFAVVGNGMIGSAAGRYLSAASDSVVLIGPAEPEGDWGEHDGVFASHYDQGRITRELDSTLEWAAWAQRSVRQYAHIEAESGISFHHPQGCIQVGQRHGRYLPKTEEVAQKLSIRYQKQNSDVFSQLHPELTFGSDIDILYEPRGRHAGYIHPRLLVKAQLTIAQQQGAYLVPETVTSYDIGPDYIELRTDQEQQIRARQVVVAAGAWTQFLTGGDLGLIPTPRTVLLAEIGKAEAERLTNMPSIVFYEGVNHPQLDGVYVLPPITYPDGKTYLKIGGRMRDIDIPQNPGALQYWFKMGGSQTEAEALEEVLMKMMPELKHEGLQMKPCVVTQQEKGHMPVMRVFIPGRMIVATAGCGSAAKSSDELGRLAAVQLQKMA